MCAELLEKAMESEIIAMCVCACVCVCVLHIPIFHHEPSHPRVGPPRRSSLSSLKPKALMQGPLSGAVVVFGCFWSPGGVRKCYKRSIQTLAQPGKWMNMASSVLQLLPYLAIAVSYIG
jgi:hypothetical protein